MADARAEASKIADETRAAIQADLDRAIARADDEISAKAVESEARITEIRAGALRSIEEVALDVVGDIVSAVAPGQKVDDSTLAAAVAARVKG